MEAEPTDIPDLHFKIEYSWWERYHLVCSDRRLIRNLNLVFLVFLVFDSLLYAFRESVSIDGIDPKFWVMYFPMTVYPLANYILPLLFVPLQKKQNARFYTHATVTLSKDHLRFGAGHAEVEEYKYSDLYVTWQNDKTIRFWGTGMRRIVLPA